MNKLDKESIIGISALLVHAANIDEIYSDHEKDLIKKFIKSYLENGDPNEFLKKAEEVEKNSNQLLNYTNIIKQNSIDIKKDIIPRSFVLNQNFPNPFNGSTEISFSIPYQSQTQIKVFDIKGAYVGTILNEKLNAGKHFIHLNTEFINQNSLSSGTYFYQLNTTNNQRVRKFLYVK